jgi:hypothetical protein
MEDINALLAAAPMAAFAKLQHCVAAPFHSSLPSTSEVEPMEDDDDQCVPEERTPTPFPLECATGVSKRPGITSKRQKLALEAVEEEPEDE